MSRANKPASKATKIATKPRRVIPPISSNVLFAKAKQRATPEQRKWLDTFSPWEAETTEGILKHYGIDYFLKYWKGHKEELDWCRNFYWDECGPW